MGSLKPSGDRAPRNPSTGIVCCARAASGHAAAAPPRSVMNSRRFTMAPVLRPKDSTLRYDRRLLHCGISSESMSAMGGKGLAHPSTHSRLTAPPLLYRRVVTLARVGEILV